MSFYAIRVGRGAPIVCDTWGECKKRVNHFPSAVYKKFASQSDAQKFAFGEGPQKGKTGTNAAGSKKTASMVIYTDGSFDGNSNLGGYAAVFVKNGEKVGIIYGPCHKGINYRNVGGEIEAAERAIAKALQLGLDSILICHDYEGIGNWADDVWRRNKPVTIAYYDTVKDARKKMDIQFQHVAAHNGIRFNEDADSYAKAGCTLDRELSEGFKGFSSGSGRTTYVCPICKKRVAKEARMCKSCGASFWKDGLKPIEKGTEGVPQAQPHAKEGKATMKTDDAKSKQNVGPSADVSLSDERPEKCPVCGMPFNDIDPAFGVQTIGPNGVINRGIVCCCRECAERARDEQVAMAKALVRRLETQIFDIF